MSKHQNINERFALFKWSSCILALDADKPGAYLDMRGCQDYGYSELPLFSCWHLCHILNCTCTPYKRQLQNDLSLKSTNDRAQIFTQDFCDLRCVDASQHLSPISVFLWSSQLLLIPSERSSDPTKLCKTLYDLARPCKTLGQKVHF